LAEYGYFTLAVLAASVITVIGAPISSAIMPRMARLHAEGKHDEFIRVYRNATQIVSVTAGSATISIIFCAEPLLFAWTGDIVLAQKTAPILQLYTAGNGFLSLAAFTYYLQYAKGNLRYHLIGNLIFVIVLIPFIIAAATYYGAIGAGFVWLIINTIFLFVWVAYVHFKIEPGMHSAWLRQDILFIIFPAIIIGSIFLFIDSWQFSRFESLLYFVFMFSLMLVFSSLFSEVIKDRFLAILGLSRI